MDFISYVKILLRCSMNLIELFYISVYIPCVEHFFGIAQWL